METNNKELFFTHDGKKVTVTGELASEAIASPLFKQWISRVHFIFTLHNIDIRIVDFTRHGEKKIFLINMAVNLTFPNKHRSDYFLTLRGGAVGILCILTYNGKKYVAIVTQPRFPVGHLLSEVPAGLLEGSNDPRSVAYRELEEEAILVSTIGFEKDDLIDLQKEIYGDSFPGVYSSSGFTDEYTHLFLLEKDITKEMFEKLHGNHGGLEEEGEDIKLALIPYDEVILKCPDEKTLSALLLYEAYKKK